MIAALMVYGLTIAALFAVLAAVAERAFAALRWPRRWVWMAAIISSLLWPVTATQMSHSVPAPDYKIIAPPIAADVPIQSVEQPARAATVTPAAVLPAWPQWPALNVILGYGWLISSLGVFAVYAIGWIRIRSAARQWDSDVVDGVALCVSDETGPAVFGVAKPRIVLPRWLLKASLETQTLVLAHERAHIQARDPLLALSALLLVALVPWNIPLLWQLRRLRFAIEVDCDVRVLRSGASATRYGKMLVAVSQSRPSLPLGALALIEPASQLERRVRIMTAGAVRHSRWLIGATAVASIALAAGAAQLPAPHVDIAGLTSSSPSDADCADQIRDAANGRTPGHVAAACWHIGPVALGMSRAEVERALGPADYFEARTRNGDEDNAFYVFPRDLAARLAAHPATEITHRDLEVTFVGGKVVRLDTAPDAVLWGPKCARDNQIVRQAGDDIAAMPYGFASIRWGESVDAVSQRLGKFTSCGVAALNADARCLPLPIAFGVPEGTDKVLSVAIAASDRDLRGRGTMEHFFMSKDPKTCLFNGYKLLPKGPAGYEAASALVPAPMLKQTASICVERPENNGTLNIRRADVMIDGKETLHLTGGQTACAGVDPGKHGIQLQSMNPYSGSDADTGIWKSKLVSVEVSAGERTVLRACGRADKATYAGWSINPSGTPCE